MKAVVTARKAGDNPLDFLIYTFEDVLVSSVQTGGSSGVADHQLAPLIFGRGLPVVQVMAVIV